MHDSEPDNEFVELLTGGQSRLFAFVLSLVADPDVAADVLQETNRVLWEKREQFTLNSDFIAWAFAVARYQVQADRQRRSRDRLIFDDELTSQLADRTVVAADSASYDPGQIAVAHCLEELPEPQQQLMQQRYREGRPLGQLAEELGRSSQSLAVTMHRIRRRLAKCIRRRLEEGES